ncbi:hypothetical protein K1719_000145 [Acacia pycnantha]|nr:hypothetical protein K1719_000145 [Acacia pycnantha]
MVKKLRNRKSRSSLSESIALVDQGGGAIAKSDQGYGGGCYRGIDHLELWGSTVKWGSEFKFNTSEGKGEGIIGLETEYGTLHIKLFPECALHSVAYILHLLALSHCAGCHFYRAESRGESWDSVGNHMENMIQRATIFMKT